MQNQFGRVFFKFVLSQILIVSEKLQNCIAGSILQPLENPFKGFHSNMDFKFTNI